MEKQNNSGEMSHSKAKRLAKQKEMAQKKRDNLVNSLIIYGVAAIVVLVILGAIGTSIYKAATKIRPSSDYSAKLEDNGFIKGVDAASKLNLCDYNNIKVNYDDIAYTDEEIESNIQSQLAAHQILNEDGSVVAQSGNKINIDFVGSVDGEEFEGGSAEGYDLTLGSGQFIDGFEEQLIGTKAGDKVDVNVTFPENYQKEELANKPAVFAVTVNGVYVDPEFDDDFVKEHLSSIAETVDDYKAAIRESNEKTRLTNYVQNYLLDNTTVVSYPESYVRNVQAVQMYTDQQNYEFMNSYYAQYGQVAYNSFNEYTGMTDAEYEAANKDDAYESVKADLVYQAILEKEGITVTVDDIKAVEGNDYETKVEAYGPGYTAKDYIQNKALEIVCDKVLIGQSKNFVE